MPSQLTTRPAEAQLIGLPNKRLNRGENRPQAALTCDQPQGPSQPRVLPCPPSSHLYRAELQLNFNGFAIFQQPPKQMKCQKSS